MSFGITVWYYKLALSFGSTVRHYKLALSFGITAWHYKLALSLAPQGCCSNLVSCMMQHHKLALPIGITVWHHKPALSIGITVWHYKIVSEYDQEIPQSQTTDNPMASRGRASQPSRDIRKTN